MCEACTCVSPIKNGFSCAAHFRRLWRLLRGSGAAERSWADGDAADGGDNLGTGGFGKVRLDRHAMSARHLHSSFTATSHADSTLTWQIHTSHFTPRLFVTGKSQHARWMCCRVHTLHVCVLCAHRLVCVRAYLNVFLLSWMWQWQPLTLPVWDRKMH